MENQPASGPDRPVTHSPPSDSLPYLASGLEIQRPAPKGASRHPPASHQAELFTHSPPSDSLP